MTARDHTDRLVARFRQGLGDDQRPLPNALERQLAEALASGQQAWPGLTVDPGDFAAYIAQLAPSEGELGEWLARLHVADLYLVCGSLAGCAVAQSALQRLIDEVVERALPRLRLPPAAADDVRQTVRSHLLVEGISGGPAALPSYSGRGPLPGWLKVVTARTAGRWLDHQNRDLPLEDDVLHDLLEPASDSGLTRQKQDYRQQFRAAFHQALPRLVEEEQLLLRQHYIDGLSIDRLGDLYGVHRATAARRITRARQTLFALTREAMSEQFGVPADDFASIVRMIESRLDVTMPSLLRKR